MLLEIEVFGSEEWFEIVAPNLDSLGLKEVEELSWSDPETDGELMGHYYDLSENDGMSIEDFIEIINDSRKTIMDGEAPFIKFNLVADKRKK